MERSLQPPFAFVGILLKWVRGIQWVSYNIARKTREISTAVKCGDWLYRKYRRHLSIRHWITDCREIFVPADDALRQKCQFHHWLQCHFFPGPNCQNIRYPVYVAYLYSYRTRMHFIGLTGTAPSLATFVAAKSNLNRSGNINGKRGIDHSVVCRTAAADFTPESFHYKSLDNF